MQKTLSLLTVLALCACQPQNSQDQQVAENQKQIELNKQKIELLNQEAEIQRLQNQIADNQVYQLAASEVANTIPQDAQAAPQEGKVVQGTDGQQYMYDSATGNWLLYGALGAAAGYLAANAMNNRNVAKYTPVSKPTAAIERVQKDFQARNPATIPAPRAAAKPATAPQQQAAKPAYRPTQQGYSNIRKSAPQRGGFGRRR